MNEPEYLNIWPTETVQFLPIRQCTLGTLIHSAKRQVSSLFAKCNRTRSSCEDLNGGLYYNRRHGWRFTINFLLNAKFYRIPADIALSHPAERVALADIIGDHPTGLVVCLHTLFQSPPLLQPVQTTHHYFLKVKQSNKGFWVASQIAP
uniref:Uncharacterized protein n=1 Tax=Solanum tuberosum TaxID=4113 RepID=M1DI26_SOLTU